MILKTRAEWTPDDLDGVAHLLTDPVYNGTGPTLTPEGIQAVRDALPLMIPPDVPALAAVQGGRVVLVFGFWPFIPGQGGMFHVAGTGEIQDAHKLIGHYLDALPLKVRTYTFKPAVARLARKAGFTSEWDQATGAYILRR